MYGLASTTAEEKVSGHRDLIGALVRINVEICVWRGACTLLPCPNPLKRRLLGYRNTDGLMEVER